MNFLLITANFYKDLADELALGAREALEELGHQVDRLNVPGVLEIPIALSMVHQGKMGNYYSGYIALGCVIRGETSHYDIVAIESARELMTYATKNRLAFGNGILTVENGDQAWARAKRDQKNKGKDAALASLSLAEIRSANS